MTDERIEARAKAQEILGYTFANPQLLDEALTHASVADHRLQSNERMEFLGDSILGAVVCEFLFRNYPQWLEGEMTKIKSAVVSRKICAAISTQIGLHNLLSLGKGMTGREGLPASLAAAVYESIVAAVYLDGGWIPARQFILLHMEPYIRQAAGSTHQQNFKSVLQQHAQQHMDHLPIYRVLDEKGPDHSKAFCIAAEVGGRRFGSAWGQSKKQAEQEAAYLALKELGVLDPPENPAESSPLRDPTD